ncbi:hypothetical protein [Paraburkholderia sp. J67]|uniref:hypothetical protein n=1 Tax=Paraburkholderia sp. J67 TaxID=2805435 RepID=UPI002ABE2556|nr:hypothetical protein [Paraburkholderia sp. J67]
MHDSSRSENGALPVYADRDRETIALARGALHLVELRRGAAIVAVEGDLLLRYRDPGLAALGQIAPEQTLHLHEGERHIARERTGYAVSAAHAAGARLLVQASQPPGLIAWIAFAARRLSRAGAWLHARPQRSEARRF